MSKIRSVSGRAAASKLPMAAAAGVVRWASVPKQIASARSTAFAEGRGIRFNTIPGDIFVDGEVRLAGRGNFHRDGAGRRGGIHDNRFCRMGSRARWKTVEDFTAERVITHARNESGVGAERMRVAYKIGGCATELFPGGQ